MNKSSRFLLLLSIALTVPVLAAEEPPDNTVIEQMAQHLGFERMTAEEVHRAETLLRMRWLVYEERLSRSGAVVLRYRDEYPLLKNVPVTERDREIIILELDGEHVAFSRDLSPEEIQRRKALASGISPQLMAKGLKAYAAGAMATGEALRQEMQNNAFGTLMTRTLGFPMQSTQGLPERIDSAELCEALLQTASGVESRAISEKSGLDLEVKTWTSINPAIFMMGPACMALRSAEVFDAIDELDPVSRLRMEESLEDALNQIAFVGREEINGRPTYRLRIDDANLVESLANLQPNAGNANSGWHDAASTMTNYGSAAARPYYRPFRPVDAGFGEEAINRPAPAVFYYEQDGLSADRTPYQPLVQQVQARGGTGAGTVAIHSIDYWIDAEYFVDRKMRMEGVMTENGQSREVFMEQEFLDYRNVPDSALYEPYRRVMRAGGMLTEAQQAELAQSQAQLEEFEQQLASMPAAQRAMMERMMGGQMEQMRSLVNNGTVEIEVITTSIEVNPDFYDPMLADFARQNMGTPAEGDSEENLLRRIQIDLTTLGYEPGNTDGVLDTMTQIAISQYQAEAGLEVTGEPSVELALALAAAVERQ